MKRKLLGLLSIFLIIPVLGCSFNGAKNDESVQSSSSLTPICDPSIKIIPLNEKTPYIGFVNGNNTTKYKVEFTNKYGKKSYLDSDYYLLRWGSSDINVVNPNLDKWFVSNGKATITCTYRDYNDNYTDSMEVTSLTRVVEKTTNYSHMLYEVNKTYDLPDSYLPTSSNLYYEISNKEVIRVDESTRKIECLSPGVSELKVSYYGDNYLQGELSSQTYIIDVINESAPKFYLNDEICSEGTLIAAKNKYTIIDPTNLGLKSVDKDNNDISNSITLIEGEYNPKELGTYSLTYKAIDSNGLYSYFFANLRIVERDYIKTEIEENNLYLDNSILKASVSTSVLKQSGVVFLSKVNYQVNINITDLYDELDAFITVTIKFQIEDWTTTAHTIKNSYIDIKGDLNFKTSGTFSNSYEPQNRQLNGNTYIETSKTVKISGYGYNYIYYE